MYLMVVEPVPQRPTTMLSSSNAHSLSNASCGFLIGEHRATLARKTEDKFCSKKVRPYHAKDLAWMLIEFVPIVWSLLNAHLAKLADKAGGAGG
eukprot:scaffold62387_cov24-Cyclotella_meneghiniana.AAC.1